jgi:hypothetical protein
MENTRIINPSDVRLYHFGTSDVLQQQNERDTRMQKLTRAMLLTHCEHLLISIFIRLPNGDMLETQSDVIDFADDFVVVKGGYVIPVRAITDIDI